MTGSSSGGGGQEQERGYISRRTLYVACFFSLVYFTARYNTEAMIAPPSGRPLSALITKLITEHQQLNIAKDRNFTN